MAGWAPVTLAPPGLPSESVPEPRARRPGPVRSREARGTRPWGGRAGGSWFLMEKSDLGRSERLREPPTPSLETSVLRLHPRTLAPRGPHPAPGKRPAHLAVPCPTPSAGILGRVRAGPEPPPQLITVAPPQVPAASPGMSS